MAVGLHAVNFADKLLNVLGNTTFTGLAVTAAKLHTSAGDPGAAGTANASANTTRMALTWSVSAAGVKSITTTLPSWASWAAGNETIAHISVWDSTTAGVFLYSFSLTTPKAVTNGDTLNLTAHSISLTPIAA